MAGVAQVLSVKNCSWAKLLAVALVVVVHRALLKYVGEVVEAAYAALLLLVQVLIVPEFAPVISYCTSPVEVCVWQAASVG